MKQATEKMLNTLYFLRVQKAFQEGDKTLYVHPDNDAGEYVVRDSIEQAALFDLKNAEQIIKLNPKLEKVLMSEAI